MPTPPKTVVLPKRQIGDRIRALREERGLSQVKLARMLGTHPQSLWQIERGVRGVTVQQLVKLARVLKVSTDEILGATKAARKLAPAENGGRRFLKRLERIQALSRDQQDAILKLLDTALQMQGQQKRRPA